MVKMYVDLTAFTRLSSVFIMKNNERVPGAKALGRTSFELLNYAKEVDVDEIVLIGSESYAKKLKEDIDKLVKIEYNNIVKEIKTTLGGF